MISHYTYTQEYMCAAEVLFSKDIQQILLYTSSLNNYICVFKASIHT